MFILFQAMKMLFMGLGVVNNNKSALFNHQFY